MANNNNELIVHQTPHLYAVVVVVVANKIGGAVKIGAVYEEGRLAQRRSDRHTGQSGLIACSFSSREAEPCVTQRHP